MNSGRLNSLKGLWLWKGDRGKGRRKVGSRKRRKTRIRNLLISKMTFSVITEERGFSLLQRK